MKRVIVNFFAVLFLVSISTARAFSQDMVYTPHVKLHAEVMVDVYLNPTLDEQGVILNKGTLIPQQSGKYVSWSGSGTVISREGHILTNEHVASSLLPEYVEDENGNGYLYIYHPTKMLYVAELRDNNYAIAPEIKYRAVPLTLYPNGDFAVLKITAYADGRPLYNPNFQFIEIANPYDIRFGDEIQLLGYPAKVGVNLNYDRGGFSGWELGRIKTPAYSAKGSSGGAALNKENKLIGALTSGTGADGAGGDMSFVHPVSWAAKPLADAAMKFNTAVPQIPVEWVQNPANTDIGKVYLFLGGHIKSAQSGKYLSDINVLVYRQDRTLDQILALKDEYTDFRYNVAPIINLYYNYGISIADLAQRFQLTQAEVQKRLAYQLSPDLEKYIEGEFFFETANTDLDGYFTVPVPRSQNVIIDYYDLIGEYHGKANRLFTDSGVYQNLGVITLIKK